MCGRARCCVSRDDILERFPSVKEWHRWKKYQPANNMSPGAFFPVIHINSSGDIVVTCMRWGLIPSFTKSDASPDYFRLFNCRSETAGEKSSFRRLLPSRRCIVLLDGFYEWVKSRDGKQPYYIYDTSSPLYVAGLFDTWNPLNTSGNDRDDEEKNVMYSFTLLTAPPNSEAMASIHDRMPLLLSASQALRWISAELTEGNNLLGDLVQQHNSTTNSLSMHPVTPRMNRASYESSDCIAPLAMKQTSLTSFFGPKDKKRSLNEETAESKTAEDDSKRKIRKQS